MADERERSEAERQRGGGEQSMLRERGGCEPLELAILKRLPDFLPLPHSNQKRKHHSNHKPQLSPSCIICTSGQNGTTANIG